ncbi:hypothetical protein [Mesobacillus selenatarsenatis]|uniref:hypothetical protein n=1 Tax=Mesobacillus selenatarsenatis TaxID=388741 RepID=UPI0005A6E749|nr:hypothetical protein [Mesobacillus selenatarsenatis]
MKLPIWFLISLSGICFLQWTLGYWIELITNNARDAFLIIIAISYIVYPVFTIFSVISLRKNKAITRTSKKIGVTLLLLGFITNPAVYQALRQVL